MKTIYLIGFMGSGKSTVGKKLAKNSSKTFIDTDDFIERTHKRKISDIFAVNGESTFRTYEIDALKQVSTYEIVSTGGGIVEKKDNLNTMKKNGIVFYLHASFEEIASRLENDDTRPLWNNEVEAKIKLYERRIPLYEQYADYIIQTNSKTVGEIVQEIKKNIRSE